MNKFEVILTVIVRLFVIPIMIILMVTHNHWEWSDLYRAAIAFALALGIVTVIFAVAFIVVTLIVCRRNHKPSNIGKEVAKEK